MVSPNPNLAPIGATTNYGFSSIDQFHVQESQSAAANLYATPVSVGPRFPRSTHQPTRRQDRQHADLAELVGRVEHVVAIAAHVVENA